MTEGIGWNTSRDGTTPIEDDADAIENLASNPDGSLSFEEAGSEIQTAGLKPAIQAAIPDANANATVIRPMVPENETPFPNGNLSAIAVTYVIHPPLRRLGESPACKGIVEARWHYASQTAA
jgi:hypothetical protein